MNSYKKNLQKQLMISLLEREKIRFVFNEKMINS